MVNPQCDEDRDVPGCVGGLGLGDDKEGGGVCEATTVDANGDPCKSCRAGAL